MPHKKQKRVKQKSLAYYRRTLWRWFALYIKLRDKYICYTCEKKCSGRDASAGHFIPKRVGGIELWFNPKNVACQCSMCNHALQGNQYIYGIKLGKKVVKELFELFEKRVSGANWTREQYSQKIEYYKAKVAELQKP